ncbi:MAG: 4-hydroxy-3-methylbut-2-en-1-yl diphosphate synthase [delta proteobacterium ML8_F1]|nr:MAG: 4-hydroxy-3-methylbut-2-en-1-yl diphosphate synthase [delta proteobacterium ML8_F1]
MHSQSREVRVGDLVLGGTQPVRIQSMTNTKTSDVKATVSQIHALENAGCELVRVAVPDMSSAKKLGAIKRAIHIPLIADIHFDHRLALEAVHQGVDKIRINPGNISDPWKLQAIVQAMKAGNIALRIGVNGGSLDKRILEKHGGPTARAMVESALEQVAVLESLDFHDIFISLKSSNVRTTLEACELISEKTAYPLHLGVTEAGTLLGGTVKSALGIGPLLMKGIGATFRVSLSADPVEEIRVAKLILQDLQIRRFGVELIACPSCGRAQIDLVALSNAVEAALKDYHKPLTVAVMGCGVNGPGEAAHADIGIAGGRQMGLIFKKGKIIRKVREEELLEALLEEIEKI